MNITNNTVELPYPDIYMKHNKVYKKIDGKEVRVSDGIGISNMKTDIDSNEREATIYYYQSGIKNECIMSRSDYLNPNNLMSIQRYGADIMKDNSYTLAMHLRNQEEVAENVNIHKTLGFGKYKGNEIYKHYNCKGVESTYEGEKEIKPKGSPDAYIDMLKEDVIGHPPLELMLGISLSSVVLGYIGEELSLDTQIVHLYGNSTTGKSTALKLAISLFGYPDVKKNGLFSTYNATENSLIKQLEGIKGVPFAFDEISMSKNKNFTEMIYKIANGVDKGRLDKNRKQVKKEPWLTTIMSNGEKSLVGSANKNAGIHIRVLEFEGVTWTKNAENSEKINSIILENYGHLGFEFAEHIMKLGKEKVKSEYYKMIQRLKRIFEKSNLKDDFIDKRANKIAIIMLTIQLFEEMIDIKLNKNEILKIILKAEKESIKQRNFDKSFIDYFKDYVSANYTKFSEDKKIDQVRDYIGNIKRKKGYLEVEVLQSKFEEIVKEGGFEDAKVVLKELKKSGYLECESDRYTRKRKTQAGITVQLIVIRIPDSISNKVS